MSYKGKLNIYTCRVCHSHMVTVDRDEGATPFCTSCTVEGCDGLMESSMYRVYDQTMRPDYEWYSPPQAMVATMPPHTREHVKMGGLILRKYEADK